VAGVESEGDGIWALELRRGGEWSEIERFGSAEKAGESLDEMAARNGLPLEDLRVRRIDA